ncbi:MAG: nucleotide pyrophosphohydrolase [Clostridia bacterium]|nr:nucleotide pyrophosphohydrolase [Deltaproteobacteria bacterium]
MSDFTGLTTRVRAFCDARDWERFHAPKNLAAALVVEAAELLEIFQWMSEDESRNIPETKLQHVREEVGDVLILLTNLASHLGIDPVAAANDKLKLNEQKYPADRVRGKALKYDEYDTK